MQLRFASLASGSGLGLAVGLVGCAEGHDERDPTIVRDSTGIEIVENLRPRWPQGEGWHVEHAPRLTISEPLSPLALEDPGAIVGTVKLRSGGFAIGDYGALGVHFIDSAGKVRRTVGGRGSGPGEFRHISALYRVGGDTLVVWDINERRYTVLSPDGDVVEIKPSARTEPLAMLRDRTIVTFARESPKESHSGRTAGDRIERRQIHLIDWDGATVGTTDPVSVSVPLTDRAYPVAFSPERAVAATDTTLVYGFPVDFRIDVYRRDGTLIRSIRRAWTGRRVRADEVAAFKAAFVEFFAPLAGRERATSAAERVEATRRHPAYSALAVDPAGNIWAREYRVWEDGVRNPSPSAVATPELWHVFGEGGVWLGGVRMPVGFQLREVGPDYVTGVARGTNGTLEIHVHTLVKASDGRPRTPS